MGLLLIGPIEGDRRRILVQPGRREGIDLQGLEGDRTKHPVQIHRKQPIEALPQSVIMERVRVKPGWSKGNIPRSSSRAPTL